MRRAPEGPPYKLLVPTHANSGDNLRLLNRLQELGYEVSKEEVSDWQAVYEVYPKPDREVAENRLTPSVRAEVSSDAD